MADPEAQQEKEGADLEQGIVNDAADVLIKAARAGVKPDEAKMAELARVLSIESPENGVDAVADSARESVRATVPEAIRYNYPLKAKVDELISKCLELGPEYKPFDLLGGDGRLYHLGDGGWLFLEKDLKTGVLVLESLMESLQNDDNLEIIARKLAILHNFPDIVGGGGYNNLGGNKELRWRLTRRLLDELKERYSMEKDDAIKDSDFVYIANRVVRLNSDDWSDEAMKQKGFNTTLTGNAKTRDILRSAM